MFGFDQAEDDYKKTQDPNQASLGHEVLAGGASFLAMHEWEEHQRNEGKEVSHGFAKEAIAALAGGAVDHIAETSGADFVDKEKAKYEAKKKSEDLYDQHYGQDPNYNPDNRGPPEHIKKNFKSKHGHY